MRYLHLLHVLVDLDGGYLVLLIDSRFQEAYHPNEVDNRQNPIHHVGRKDNLDALEREYQVQVV